MNPVKITMTINGKRTTISSMPNRTLLEVLREDLHLTGAKGACGGEGECGACTVILNRNAVNACLVLIGQAHNSIIETIEGLKQNDLLHPIQKAFIEAGAVQCGFCTPGAILSAKALLDKISSPSETEIREALSGNLCRCTGYTKIIKAVQLAAKDYNHVS